MTTASQKAMCGRHVRAMAAVGLFPSGEPGSLMPSWGERREAEQAIGRHAKRDVIVPARLAQLT